MKYREVNEVLIDIETLVSSKGYLYTLCMIIVEDFHVSAEELHNIDYRARLNRNEVSLLIGFLIKKKLDISYPESPQDLLKKKRKSYTLMDELHSALSIPSIKKFKPLLENKDSKHSLSKEEFFGGDDMFTEPIFYSGDGIYDFQYLDYLDQKYKYDETWLNVNKQFYFESAKEFVYKIRNIHRVKFKNVNFLSLKENEAEIIKTFKNKKYYSKSKISEYLSLNEFSQYVNFFDFEVNNNTKFRFDNINSHNWNSFYAKLLDLFIVKQSDIEFKKYKDYFDNFSIDPENISLNAKFNEVGDYNVFTSKPLIRLDDERYFVPISYSLFEAVYESPFYWMFEDKSYRDTIAKNRGSVGEEITYKLLEKVFGKENTYKSVLIESKKGHSDTDIDIICILGNKALCVQVKSKKLTQLSRRGNYKQLQTDFKGAVQDAYDQGIVSRDRIIEGTSVFYDEGGKKINISENIDEVYILGVTTENYPALTHQSNILLKKRSDEPYPLFLTVFDLELVSFYLNNPYEFLYYVRQRIQLMDYHYGNEEIHFLGYHLIQKLWKDPNYDFMQIDGSYGQLVDRNYYPLKSGIKTKKNNDKLESRWTNSGFDLFLKQISELNSPKTTDIIFHFLDWSQDSRENLVERIRMVKEKTFDDTLSHDFSMFPGLERSTFGLTYISWNNNSIEELNERVYHHCELRKYKSKADYWICIGCLKNSGRMVDSMVLMDEKWSYNQVLEEEVERLLGNSTPSTAMKVGRKIGRNDFCLCGSGIKYKKCCGRNY